MSEESRPKNSKLAKKKTFAPPCLEFNELGKTFCLEKKKEYLMNKKQDWKNSMPVIKNNIIRVGKKKQNDSSNQKCYNY